MALRPITETCEPRQDVLSGGLTDAHFAAQLDQVVRSPEKYPVYGDPTEFFAITYPTEGLRALLTSTFGRLSGKGGKTPGAEHGVVRFQTSFGGGKTHGLIAAYHLARGARPVAIGEFLDPDLLPDHCQVAAVVGDALDERAGERSVNTMWGAIAAQLGDEAWDRMQSLDERRTAPDKSVWIDVFSGRPTLVIIDEIAAYMRRLNASGDPDMRRLGEAMPAFLFGLFSAAAEVPTTRVIITLATAQDAFGRETTDVEKVLDSLAETSSEMQSVMSRYGEVLVPAEDEDISEILRRRLFTRIDDDAAANAGDAFRDFYLDLESKEMRLGMTGDVAERVRRSYPFHPELIRVLDARIGTIPSFQRTRGALRLLAEAVASVWAAKAAPPILNVADVPLDEPAVAGALTRGIGREAYAQVIEVDVAGPGSHAAEIDASRFSGTTPYATKAATTVLLHSLEQTAATGATLVDVWRGTLAPGDEPQLVEEALRQLETGCWHYYYDASRYRFQTEPNPRKIIEDERSSIAPSMVREELEHRVKTTYASAGAVKTTVFPSGPAAIEDRPELQLAVMHFDDLTVTGRNASPPPGVLIDLRDTYGVGGANRTNRNGLMFLVADADQVEPMREAVRYHLAAQRVVADSERMQQYAPEVQKKLRAIAHTSANDARVSITRCYRHLYYPKADRANDHLRHHELSLTDQGDQEKPQTPIIQQALTQIGKVRTTPVSSDFLAHVAGFPKTDPISTGQVVESFWRNHDADLILDQTIIQDALVSGVRNGTWVYYDAETERAYTADSPPPALRIHSSTYLYTRGKAEADGILAQPVTWDAIRREIHQASDVIAGTDLRAALEESLGSEPTKQSVTEVLSRVLKQPDAPIVVVSGEPVAESKPLAPSAVEKASLDRLTILTREKAESLGLEVVVRRVGFRFDETHPAGQAFARISDKIAEAGGEKLEVVSVTFDIPDGTTAGVRTFLSAQGMLPKLQFEVTFHIAATFPDLSGSVAVESLSGPRGAINSVEKQILDLLDEADDLTGSVTLTYHPEQSVAVDSSEWRTLVDTFTDLKPGVVTVEVRGQ